MIDNQEEGKEDRINARKKETAADEEEKKWSFWSGKERLNKRG